jgi:hypothetical protein
MLKREKEEEVWPIIYNAGVRLSKFDEADNKFERIKFDRPKLKKKFSTLI